MLFKMIILLSLQSCGMKMGNYIMRPYGEAHVRSCVYHNYGGLPPCKGYNFLPVDKGVGIIHKRHYDINNYNQYKGRIK